MFEPKNLILIGGGEHAGVVAESARKSPRWNVVGYVDKYSKEHWPEMWVGDDGWFKENYEEYFAIICCSGNPKDNRRTQIIERYRDTTIKWVNIIDLSSEIIYNVKFGVGVYIAPGAILNTEVAIGDHCIINTGSIIEHTCILNENVRIAPGVVLGGNVEIGENTTIGLGAKIRDHIKIGRNSIVGMGAVVVKDVSDNKMVLGVPAKVVGDV